MRKLPLLIALMVGLPAMGVLLSGKSLTPYLEFPPRNTFLAHANFSWVVFLSMGFVVALCVGLFVRRFLKYRVIARDEVTMHPFPWWGWLGLLCMGVFWILSWTRFHWFAWFQYHTFTPLWLTYIVVMNALVWRRTGRCPVTQTPGRFFVLFPLSAMFWWLFEYLNRYVQNWHYTADQFSATEYFWAATLPFSTVLPAVFSTKEWLSTFPNWQKAFEKAWAVPAVVSRRFAVVAGLLGMLTLAGIGVFPNFLYSLLWVSPLLIMLAWQILNDEKNILSDVVHGDWRQVVGWSVAALICGFFWEMWNYYSQAKWFYTVPFVNRFHIFEMPVLGFAGYLPFGLECAVVTAWVMDRKLDSKGMCVSHFSGKALRWSIGLVLFLLVANTFPRWWCGRQADAWFEGDRQLQQRLAGTVGEWVNKDLGRNNFTTGSQLFDGEWLFGTYMMAAMGFGQTAIEHPEWRERHLHLMELCIERVLSPAVREFDREMWNDDPVKSLDGNSEHAAYLGYLNLILGLHRLLDPHSKYVDLNDRITNALVRRLEKNPIHLLQSYPNETYPMDNCAVIGSIGLYDRVTGADHSRLLSDWVKRCRTKYRDSKSGLLYQGVDTHDGLPADQPRGSGSTLGLYFLSFADANFSRELFVSCKRELTRSYFGFGVMKEYPSNSQGGTGDIDSGPVVMGIGLSPTGFMLAGCRIHGDRKLFTRLYRTASLFGAPVNHRDNLEFITGGPLGNAIMFGVLTALPVEKLNPQAVKGGVKK